MLNDSGQPAPSSGIRIAGNTTYGNSLGGIEVNSGTGAGGSHSNVTIIGNHSYGNTLANATQQGEVKVDHVNQAQVARSGTTRRPRRWPSLNGTAGAGWTTVGNTLGATIGASDNLAAPIASLGAAPVPSGWLPRHRLRDQLHDLHLGAVLHREQPERIASHEPCDHGDHAHDHQPQRRREPVLLGLPAVRKPSS